MPKHFHAILIQFLMPVKYLFKYGLKESSLFYENCDIQLLFSLCVFIDFLFNNIFYISQLPSFISFSYHYFSPEKIELFHPKFSANHEDFFSLENRLL